MLRLRALTTSILKTNLNRLISTFKIHETFHKNNAKYFVDNDIFQKRLFCNSTPKDLPLDYLKKYTTNLSINGIEFTIRPMLPSDTLREKKFVNSLSFETVYNRRFGSHKYSDSEIDKLTHIDYSKDFALVVTKPQDGEFVAVARYHTGNLPKEECDFAVVVADEYQGKGIAKVLVERLMEIAKEFHKKKIFRSEVLHSNYHTIHLNDMLDSVFISEIHSEILSRILHIKMNFVTNILSRSRTKSFDAQRNSEISAVHNELQRKSEMIQSDEKSFTNQLMTKYSNIGNDDESGLINDQKMESSDNHIYSLLKTKYPVAMNALLTDVSIALVDSVAKLSHLFERTNFIIRELTHLDSSIQNGISSPSSSSVITTAHVSRGVRSMLGVPFQNPSPVKKEIIKYFSVLDDIINQVSDLVASDNEWTYLGVKENVQIYKRQMANSQIQCVKGIGEINASPESIKTVIKDLTQASKWDPLFLEGKILEQLDKHTEILHLKFSAKYCILEQKRDFTLLYHWFQRSDGSILIVGRSIDIQDRCPLESGFIRGEVMASGYLISPMADNPEKSTVVYVSNIDIKALELLPEFITAKFINMLNEKQPLNIARIAKYMGMKGITTTSTTSPNGTPQMSMRSFTNLFADVHHVKHTTPFPDIADALSNLEKSISHSEIEAVILMMCIDYLKRPLSLEVAKLIAAIILHEQVKALDKYSLDELKKTVISKLDPINKLTIKNDIWMLESYAMSIQGGRSQMEDRITMFLNLQELLNIPTKKRTLFWGVYDGHGGYVAADYVRTHLHVNIVKNEHYATDKQRAFKDAFIKTHSDFVEKAKKVSEDSGTTATALLIEDDTLFIGNVGDSSAVLARGRKETPIILTVDHKASNEQEKERLEKSGAMVIWMGGTWRVNGNIAISRAIGDMFMSYLSAEPYFFDHKITPEDDFCIVATDGLWDVFKLEEAVEYVYSFPKNSSDTVSMALAREAHQRGSSDNITVLVVYLKPSKSI